VTQVELMPIDACDLAVPADSIGALPDLVVVSAGGAMESADCVREIRAKDPRRLVPVVVLCVHSEPGLQACLNAGANGLLPTDD